MGFLSKSYTELLEKVTKEYTRYLAELFVLTFGLLVRANLENLIPSPLTE